MVVSCLANMVEIKGPCRAATQSGGSVSDSRERRCALYAASHGCVGPLSVVLLCLFGCFLALSWPEPGFWRLLCARSRFCSARGLPELKLVLSCYSRAVCVRVLHVIGYSCYRDGYSRYFCLSRVLAICFTAAFLSISIIWASGQGVLTSVIPDGYGSAGYGTACQGDDSANGRTRKRIGFGGGDGVECEDRDSSVITATLVFSEADFKGGSVGRFTRSFTADCSAMTLHRRKCPHCDSCSDSPLNLIE